MVVCLDCGIERVKDTRCLLASYPPSSLYFCPKCETSIEVLDSEDTDLQRLERLEKLSGKISKQINDIKRKHGIGIFCCRDAENSLGWHHSGNCKNWVLTY